MKTLFQCLAPAVLLFASTAHAEMYIGGATGDGHYEATEQGIPFKAEDSGSKAFVGFKKGRFFAIEGGYLDMADLESTVGTDRLNVDVTGWDLFVVLVLPLGKRTELFAKGGGLAWETESTFFDGMTTAPPVEADGTDFAYAVGIGYLLGRHFSVRVEQEYFEIEGTDKVKFTSLGLEIRF